MENNFKNVKTSTKQDIFSNIDELVKFGREMIARGIEGGDEWDAIVIGDLVFDVNAWERDGISERQSVAVYPVTVDENGMLLTNTSDFIQILSVEETVKVLI